MRFTLFDIDNSERFFKMVERCSGPVRVSAAGRCEDIRGNEFLSGLLTGASGGKIARLELDVESEQDVPVLCHYMMQSGM